MSDQSLGNDNAFTHGLRKPFSSCEGQEPWVMCAHVHIRCAPEFAIRETFGVIPRLWRKVVTVGATSSGIRQKIDSPSIVMLDLTPVEPPDQAIAASVNTSLETNPFKDGPGRDWTKTSGDQS